MNTHYEKSLHRLDETSISKVQEGNVQWWTDHTMSYDWESTIECEKQSLPWFDEIDRRFVRDSRLFGHDVKPFDKMIPYDRLHGKRVLEIGCGMGFHTEMLVKCGAIVTAIDISETSIAATRKRLSLKGLSAEVERHDAESLPFSDGMFDFVWSWGVIHHSSRTAAIVREIARVLNTEGESRVMVYNRDGACAWRAMIKYHVLMLGALRGRSSDEALNRNTDGFHARHYTKDQFEDLFRAFFGNVSSSVCGQVSDALPLPRQIRKPIERVISEKWLVKKQKTRGSFIFLTANQPYAR
jgi:2-polyprenyl-3-methyl-5-hydroxy-6-metoxy-1,4-benzoquinol methylase